jgi:soluble lytic murein transglycosylase
VRRSHPLATHRLLIAGVLVVLGVVTLLGARGPAWFQRLYYPLEYRREILEAAQRHRINPYLVAAVIEAESDFDPGTRSSAGAVGLMQVMPQTAEDILAQKLVSGDVVAGKDLSDPGANIEFGTAYLRYLVDRYHEVEKVLAAYNAGLRHVDRWSEKGGDIREAIEFPETKRYVLRVVRARDRYERLYPDAFAGWEAK